ncbi:MAG: [FeFe] hydrogenase H-cluster radical SAM maturase HydE [Candidatus Delongbacteria bacterium]|nr:[FeFe] hydrogenase H-cluster radical SAM maturase HydE [Candidatus Delongbacteria bacterium]MBN2833835.1 [FeFe] hydrogenase H-cluster radical SAM maturase HydE [Candidatus Delongbacteria bacterium]
MDYRLDEILNRDFLEKDHLIYLLSLNNENDIEKLFNKAYEIKTKYVGRKVYYRGLIEYSNVCAKDCYYCGIRKSNKSYKRYTMTDDEVLEAAKAAFDYNYGSVVIQAGEIESEAFTNKIVKLVSEIKSLSDGKLGITLSLGEQTEEVYKKFFEAGAHRYLLRIETTNENLYSKIHPADHSFKRRVECLHSLKNVGFQTGTGVMIGLPDQTIEDLANDLLFFREFDIDMIGMGPFIEAEDTPMFKDKDRLLSKKERFNLALKMIAVLRIMMKDINIASATALQAIIEDGREQGLKVGSNIIMPNLTPVKYRADYQLYDDKPCIDEEASKCRHCLDARVRYAGDEVGYGEWGDSKHFAKRK